MNDSKSNLRDKRGFRWTMLALLSFTMLCSYYLSDAMAPLEQRLEIGLNWSSTDYGIYSGAYGWFNVFLLMLVFGGMILDKMGARFTGILAICFMMTGAAVKYWAVSGHVAGDTVNIGIGSFDFFSVSKSALTAGVGFAIFGVGVEMFGISANKAIIKWFRGKEMALAIGLNTSVGRVGTALAMFTPIPLVDMTKNLAAPILLSLLLLCIGLITYIIFNVFDRKLDKEELVEGAPAEEFKFSDIKKIVEVKAFWLISIICLMFYSAVFPFIKYVTQLIMQKYKVPDEFAGYIPALLPFAALLLIPVFGNVFDKKGKGASLMILGSVMLFVVYLFFSIPSFNSLYVAIGLIVILGIAFSMVPSAMWPAIAKIIPEQRVGTAYSLVFWIQNWGLMLVPMFIGSILDKYCIEGTATKLIDGVEMEVTQYDFTLPMLIFAGFGALSVIFAVWLKKEDAGKGYGLERANIATYTPTK